MSYYLTGGMFNSVFPDHRCAKYLKQPRHIRLFIEQPAKWISNVVNDLQRFCNYERLAADSSTWTRSSERPAGYLHMVM